jgi:hypothetical protein
MKLIDDWSFVAAGVQFGARMCQIVWYYGITGMKL